MSSLGSLQLAVGSLSINGFSASSIMGAGVSQPRSSPLACSSNAHNLITLMSLKRWERQEVKPNSLPVVRKMHVKTGDTVKVISGADKGKIGEITKLYTHNSKVVIKDVNIKTKHVKGKQEGETGQILQVEAPIHSSNVMLYSKKEKLTSRVGHKILEDGRKVRYLLKTGELLDTPEEWKKLHKDKKKEKSA